MVAFLTGYFIINSERCVVYG